ncbi:hypothetical protein BKA62DRAFT_702016, partial [Auriculariales sp. MPI-PUGE-AT-0066]
MLHSWRPVFLLYSFVVFCTAYELPRLLPISQHQDTSSAGKNIHSRGPPLFAVHWKDGAGTAWTGEYEEIGNGQTSYFERSDTFLKYMCPMETYEATGLDGMVGHVISRSSHVLVHAGVDFTQTGYIDNFTVFMALDLTGDPTTPGINAMVGYRNEVGEVRSHVRSFILDAGADFCSISLPQEWFVADLPSIVSLDSVWVGPNENTQGLVIFNLTGTTRIVTSPTQTASNTPKPTTTSSQPTSGSPHTDSQSTSNTLAGTSVDPRMSTSTAGGSSETDNGNPLPTSEPSGDISRSGTTENGVPPSTSHQMRIVAIVTPLAIFIVLTIGAFIWRLLRKSRKSTNSAGAREELRSETIWPHSYVAGALETNDPLQQHRNQKLSRFIDACGPQSKHNSRLSSADHASSETGQDEESVAETADQALGPAARRAGIPAHALLHALDQMLPDDRQSGGMATAPPRYSGV